MITGFGRLGPAFAAERYGVIPDMITFAKGVTSGAVPMGGVLVRHDIHQAFMNGPEHAIEFFHGYTYSAHPLRGRGRSCGARSLSRRRSVRTRQKLEPLWYDACMSLKSLPHVLDIRCVGLTVGIDLSSKPGAVGMRGFEAMERGFHDEGLMLRAVGDSLAMSPPLIVSEGADRRDLRKDRQR